MVDAGKFYTLSDTPAVMDVAVEAGRAAHMVRNVLQGYVDLRYPEAATSDNLCGGMEGVLRQMRSALREGREIKPMVTQCAKTTTFLIKVAATWEDPAVCAERRSQVRELLAVVLRCLKHIDQEVNNAITASSAAMFGETTEHNPQTHTASGLVAKAFTSQAAKEAYERGGSAKGSDERGRALVELGYCLSNTAHLVQDQCSADLMNPSVQVKQGCQEVVGLAGKAENEARALITLATIHKEGPPPGPYKKHLEGIEKHILGITEASNSLSQQTFNSSDHLRSGIAELQMLTDSARRCFSAGAA